MNDIDIAWCAGLFEGEGSIFRFMIKRYTYHRLTIKMTDLDVLEKFKLKTRKGLIIAQTDRSIKKGQSNWKRYYVWHLNNREEIQELLKLFWPHLCHRRRAKILELELLKIEDLN